jgi:hypothetical protein
MKYLVTNQFGGGADRAADKLAAALKAPLGQIGVTVERARGDVSGGFQAVGLSADAYKRKHDEVGRVVRLVMSAGAALDAVGQPRGASFRAGPGARLRKGGDDDRKGRER